MGTVSLCMIVRDDEKVLPRCLDSIGKIADEIIIVDTGSSDHTREIALRYTGHVYDYLWQDDFAAARNFSFSLGTMDYLLWMDADEVLEPDDAIRLSELKNTLNESIHMVALRYGTEWESGEYSAPVRYQERLVRRDAGFHWEGAVNEIIVPQGNRIQADITITCKNPIQRCKSERNLKIYEKLILSGYPLSTRDRFYYAHELTAAGRNGEAAALFEDFLASPEGGAEEKTNACIDLASCYERMGDPEQRISALLQGMAYEVPKPEHCCELGRFFLEKGQYSTAAFWYELALKNGSDRESPSSGWLPCIQLCDCYNHLGEHLRAREYNERAAAWKPNDETIALNRQYFRSLGI